MKVIVLGCGSSGGVPLITGDWGACDPTNPKNRRRRSSVLVQVEGYNILIDTSPDLREQLLDNHIERIDLVLFTHTHADHVNGLDDLRQLVIKSKKQIPIYATKRDLDDLFQRYEYIFKQRDPLYPPFLDAHEIIGEGDFDEFVWNTVAITPFRQFHDKQGSLGFRIGDFAYSTDMKDLPDESIAKLQGLKLWIVDCLQEEPHYTHSHLDNTLALIERVRPERAILTHMAHHLDYEVLAAKLPVGIVPAYDNMVIEGADFFG